ncbi:unnamed protein product [Orchesella dallaii]|uniref:Uncharacterized protein n=1 Tax=Orchesella dallaii TaxID=48710 RepID=A0ABP1PWP0_9HEXA
MEKIDIGYLQFMLLLGLMIFSACGLNADLYKVINWTNDIVCSVHEISDYTNYDPYNTSLETWHRDSSHETTDFEMNVSSTHFVTIFSKAPRKELKSRFPLSFQLNLEGAMSIEETVYLLYLNMENKLSSARNQLLVHPDIEWKKIVMDKIIQIFLVGCPSVFVPKGYIHMIKELFLHYQTQFYLANGGVGTFKHGQIETTEKWDLIISHVLKDCLWSSSKLELIEENIRIYELWTSSLETNGHKKIEIHPPEEHADTHPTFSQKDEIIDEAWWIFSFVYGYCFHHFQNSSIKGEPSKDPIRQQKQNPLNVPTAEEFFQLFEKDFLIDLKTRWMNAGEYGRAFGTIFGEPRHTVIKRNLRYCVTAAYVENSIEDYQLLRPFKFQFENSRTGTPIH